VDVDREITIRDYLAVIWSGRWLILATTVLGLIVGILVSIAHGGSYSAAARVYLGQPTSVNGVPLQTPLTNAQTAVSALDMTGLADAVAQKLDRPQSAVRGHVQVGTPPGVTSGGTAPAVLNVVATTPRAADAVAVANEFAAEVVASYGAPEAQVLRSYTQQINQARAEILLLKSRIAALPATSANAVALTTLTQELTTAQENEATTVNTLNKAQQTEVARVLAPAHSAAPATSSPKRLQSIALAGLVGLLLGIVATFIWRGSPGGRASDSPESAS
jgi:uncharacterized protein involved in exopolysaccharide biosynthesis